MAITHDLKTYLKKYFGYDDFRPGQEDIIKHILTGKDVLAVMPTGGGKSLCFQLPALVSEGTAIVISPLIALMKDQVDALCANGIAAACYNSNQTPESQSELWAGLRAGTLKLLYIAPESLQHLVQEFGQHKISMIAVDEAHCISSWGHDFRPAYTRLQDLKERFPGVPVAAFTATADAATREDILFQLNIREAHTHIASFDRENIFLEVRPGTSRFTQIMSFLHEHPGESGIIYCLSRRSTEQLAAKLRDREVDAAAYHAGMTPEERSRVQEDFVNDRIPVVVATIAFGMGIDKSNVRWVIHYNMPRNVEGYYQEIGRSGRDGLPAHALLFYSYADVIQQRRFIENTPTEEVQSAKLERMQQFAETLHCRRITLLHYFGEKLEKGCGHCDVCKSPPRYFDGTVLAQKVCSAVARLKEQEALGMVTDVLRGAQNAAVFDKGYQHLKTYGAARDVAWRQLQQYIIQMINQGILEVRFQEHGRLLLTDAAREVLFNGRTVKLAHTETPSAKKKKVSPADRTTEGNDGLFVRLKKLRSEIASEEKMPAYIIFNDASLRDMESKCPSDREEFGRILGVGQVKLEKYADRFLEVIAGYKAEQQKKLATEDQTFVLYKQGHDVGYIAEKRMLKEETVMGHLLKKHQQGEAIDLMGFITEDEVKLLREAREVLEEKEALKPYYDHFKGALPYWKIKFGLYLIEQTV
ncbi:DNA helicase RecQ [Sinomicrobium soli]|uniref:DNA helicase RecQ n=1 Tax=Sinomicrobium sp. N-1-3-6 TaxID=2219864 RepID=UPI000DCC71F8|nr:DNA helicase RecQ [Sinomicrobium sp. N-1-3-6]RAV30364.1 DNA helicase RecQ [Sinomicrobium sp. N-1-3-6]